MKNQHNISPDDLFRENLNGFEAQYEEKGWEKMSAMLDKSETKRPFFWWFYKNKKNSLISLITLTMIISTIIIALQFVTSGMDKSTLAAKEKIQIESNKPENKNKFYSQLKNIKMAEQNETHVSKTAGESYSIRSKKDGEIGGSKENYGTVSAGDLKYQKPAISNVKNEGDMLTVSETKTVENVAEANPISAPDSTESTATKTATQNPTTPLNTTISKTLAMPQLPKPKSTIVSKKDYGKFDGPFRGGWIGIHYTSQYPQTPVLQDSWRQNAGFNFQFMSRNLTGRRDFSGYLGFDFGMQFTGRGEKSGIVLDNKNVDSGFTRLSNHSLDLFARGHFEYDKFRLKPYFNVFAGPRIFSTSQYTEAYHQSTQYENSNNTNAFSSMSWMYGAGVGLRYRLGTSVSLDMRYEFMQGTETSLVNIDKSTFNGLSYNLNKFRVKPAYTQFKVGFLFDVGSEKEEQHKDESEEVTEYYQYDSTTQTYTKVNCHCKQWTVSDTSGEDSIIVVKKARNYYPIYDPNYTPNNTGGRSGSFPSGSGSGGSSGGKGSFPGIKPGGGGIKPKS